MHNVPKIIMSDNELLLHKIIILLGNKNIVRYHEIVQYEAVDYRNFPVICQSKQIPIKYFKNF